MSQVVGIGVLNYCTAGQVDGFRGQVRYRGGTEDHKM